MQCESYPLPVSLQRAVLAAVPVASTPDQAAELIANENRSASTLARVPGPLDCAECGSEEKTYAWLADRPRLLCAGCREKAIEAKRETDRAEIRQFEAMTKATQKPRKLSYADVGAKLDLVGLECEHLELVLALAVREAKRSPNLDELGFAVRAIRHCRTVLIGSMKESDEKALAALLNEKREAVDDDEVAFIDELIEEGVAP